jgi:hypothetical protein
MFDARPLALFRISISLVVIIDILNRMRDMGVHYRTEGVLPFSILFERHWNEWHWSLYTVSAHPLWPALLMMTTLGCALSMFFGWRTRTSTVLL